MYAQQHKNSPKRDGMRLFPGKNALRLRVEALQSGAPRVTRTLREEFLPVESNVVIHREPGEFSVSKKWPQPLF